MKKAYLYETVMGQVGVAENGGAITNLFFGSTVKPTEYALEETPLLQEAAKQLAEYLGGVRKAFDLPLAPEGTEFERAVWAALCEIPFGETRSYKQIAEAVRAPKAFRAVGRANGRNPISIFIPCHRVVGASGKLTGYAGGLDMKQRLLLLEKGGKF